MRRLIRRRKRLTALSLMLAMAAFIVTLPGWKRFEPTATAQAGITIVSTEAQLTAVATVQGISDSKDTGKISTWTTSFDKVWNARVDFGTTATADDGELHAKRDDKRRSVDLQ